ncbi:hypothetical protein GGR52DRAFT_569502 [Hypoxylon sp. FL1284]|nr:hypothetical protein GGR52DRAFT_569502 [Hypoxylon sp. FL1284]
MSFGPPRPPRRSRRLPRELEDEIKSEVFEVDDGPNIEDTPHLIVGNRDSCCHGVCYVTPEGTEFFFHHAKGKYNTECGCIIKCEPDEETLELPQELRIHRLRLMYRSVYRMEAKFASMVVMKIFLGIEVPEEVGLEPWRALYGVPEQQEQEEAGGSSSQTATQENAE